MKTDSENQLLQRLVEQVQSTQVDYAEAAEHWNALQDAQASAELDAAVAAYQRATAELAEHVSAWYRTGFRLCVK